ncbi:TadE/TadG family type IV pilus assembly protein [Sphingomonas bacterium]|uniref:TadE/TadG family type IV pilus assembly protein n=1 Tax=Sphingomonas bacterium TaxID=1895847 RepID=UPI001576285E|nr:TadE/TadG family type IV pilus assembly protein [Sphingomonas bacterium]
MAWRRRPDRGGGFIGRLRRDVAGNTLAIMAAALIPILGLAGSAVDTARLYVVKVRLQQACDTGALAARKSMATNGLTSLDTAAQAQGKAFFANNFSSGYMGTPAFTNATAPYPFVSADTSDHQVQGNASVDVPMTLMAMLPFGAKTQTIRVTCQARYDTPDTDIVFVLDTTGSMACLPGDTDADCDTYVKNNAAKPYTRPADSSLNASDGDTGSANDSVAGYPGSTSYAVPEKSGSKIAAVRTAVINFAATVTNNIAKTQTRIRYGFVPYSSTVNAGKAIMNASPGYMIGGAGSSGATTWTFQSRYIDPANTNSQYVVPSTSQNPNPVTTTDGTSQSNCTGSTRTPAAATGQPYTFNAGSSATIATRAWSAQAAKCQVTTTTYGPSWTYGPIPFDVRNFLVNRSVSDPSKLDGTTSSWQGCIEERRTTPGVMTFSPTSLPADLDPDLAPTNDDTRWRPMWPDVIYWRNYSISGGTFFGSTGNAMDSAGNAGDTDKTSFYYSSNAPNAFSLQYYGNGVLAAGGSIACGKPIRRVSVLTQQDVANYVNASDFVPLGGTYHDTGMIWGTRLLSTVGPFGSDLTPQPGAVPTNKVIIFLTDGAMSPSLSVYGMYGLEYFDKRVTNGDYSPTSSNPNTNQTAYHNARFLAECAKARAMNVSVWTIMLTTNTTATAPLQQCATTSAQSLVTAKGDDLNTKFQNIAAQIAKLRISQ